MCLHRSCLLDVQLLSGDCLPNSHDKIIRLCDIANTRVCVVAAAAAAAGAAAAAAASAGKHWACAKNFSPCKPSQSCALYGSHHDVVIFFPVCLLQELSRLREEYNSLTCIFMYLALLSTGGSSAAAAAAGGAAAAAAAAGGSAGPTSYF